MIKYIQKIVYSHKIYDNGGLRDYVWLIRVPSCLLYVLFEYNEFLNFYFNHIK